MIWIMKQEDIHLLHRDLCARFPYKTIVHVHFGAYEFNGIISSMAGGWVRVDDGAGEQTCNIRDVKPYLRPMESMTEEEKYIWHSKMKYAGYFINYKYYDTVDSFDYLNSIHVDYRGLIPKGLALPAKEGMYNLNID